MDKFYSKIINYVDSVIRDHDYSISFDKLSECDKRQLAMYFFEYDERDLSFLLDSQHTDNIQSYLISILKRDTNKGHIDLSESIIDAIVDNYAKKIDQLLDERLVWVVKEDAFENGYYSPNIDSTNGEASWGNHARI